MPFSLKMSQDVFQMCMDQVMDHLPSIIAIHDDICVHGHTPQEHDKHLLKLMQTAAQYGTVFNSSKYQIRQPQITFYGAMFTTKGMWPDPSKIQVLQELSMPKSPTKLQLFLGLINYLQLFIQGLANKTMFLKEQTAEWDWNPLTDAMFQCVKARICQTFLNTMLVYYDWSKPVIVQNNACEHGLSAVLIQCCRPITFASKTLTDIKTHYANIKGSVCMLWSRKFHISLYSRHVIIENDHKPLEMI